MSIMRLGVIHLQERRDTFGGFSIEKPLNFIGRPLHL